MGWLGNWSAHTRTMKCKIKKTISIKGVIYEAGKEVEIDDEIARSYGSEYLEMRSDEIKPPKRAYKNKQLRTYKSRKVKRAKK